jgi:hypothetical protein
VARINKSKKLEGQALDNLLDALVWMRRKVRKRQPVDVLIDELVVMRRTAKKKAARQKKVKGQATRRAKPTRRVKQK